MSQEWSRDMINIFVEYAFLASACAMILFIFPTAFLYVNDYNISFKICFGMLLTSCALCIACGVMLLIMRCTVSYYC